MESSRSDTGSVEISVVIPARNEESQLPRTLEAAHAQLAGYNYEIIVVDNGSTDATVGLAKAAGATVLSRPGISLGALRNQGVAHARGKFLLFLDADISLTPEWRDRLPAALAAMQRGLVMTGSHYAVPEDGTWIERNWFDHIVEDRRVTHLATGHMMLSMDTFARIGGFDETLRTGEDFEICQRLLAAGGEIVNDPALKAIHHGFPKDLPWFIRREAWHGAGDVQSWRHFVRSKVSMAAAGFAGAHVLLFGLLVPGFRWVGVLGLVMLLALLVGSVRLKYRHAPLGAQAANLVLFYVYYLGRVLAFSGLVGRPARKASAEPLQVDPLGPAALGGLAQRAGVGRDRRLDARAEQVAVTQPLDKKVEEHADLR